jgi:hypothetical protein
MRFGMSAGRKLHARQQRRIARELTQTADKGVRISRRWLKEAVYAVLDQFRQPADP